jgi:hypothetical protein
MLLFSVVGKGKKKPLPKFSLVFETTALVTPPRDLDKHTNITIGDRLIKLEANDLGT